MAGGFTWAGWRLRRTSLHYGPGDRHRHYCRLPRAGQPEVRPAQAAPHFAGVPSRRDEALPRSNPLHATGGHRGYAEVASAADDGAGGGPVHPGFLSERSKPQYSDSDVLRGLGRRRLGQSHGGRVDSQASRQLQQLARTPRLETHRSVRWPGPGQLTNRRFVSWQGRETYKSPICKLAGPGQLTNR